MPTLAVRQAEELVAATLSRCRTSPDNARAVARALVAAEADGLKGHGLSRLPSYAAQAKVGKVDGFAVPHEVREDARQRRACLNLVLRFGYRLHGGTT